MTTPAAPPPLPVQAFFTRPRLFALAGVVLAVGLLIWAPWKATGPGPGFVSGNGRIEAVDIDIASKLPGRIDAILVAEGDLVKAGQPLARMRMDAMQAQRDEAQAMVRQAGDGVASEVAQVAARQSDQVAAEALVRQRASELEVGQRRYVRTQELTAAGATTLQALDDDKARVLGAEAGLAWAKAQVAASRAGVQAAQAGVTGAVSGVAAAQATVARIDADIHDGVLVSPRDGRVQYRVAEPGEVVAAGGKVLNLVDLGDVTMSFFIPETAAGRVALGADVRLILDAAPEWVVPATVTFVASVAQFTPKTVETASERQKLMFRVKARISPELLAQHATTVKTGLPGVAWLKLDPQAAWPANLEIRLPR